MSRGDAAASAPAVGTALVVRADYAVVTALHRGLRAWFADEDLAARVANRRHAAYFDLGVEHGIAAARASQIPGATKQARAIAEHLVQEVVGSGVEPRVRVEATVLACWAMVGRKAARRELR